MDKKTENKVKIINKTFEAIKKDNKGMSNISLPRVAEELSMPFEELTSFFLTVEDIYLNEQQRINNRLETYLDAEVSKIKTANEANRYKGLLSLNKEIYTANCEPNTVIMHPLPRDSRKESNEINADLFDNPNLAIFRQADNGVVIRMALFALVLDVLDQVKDTSRKVNWKTTKNI